MISAVRTARMPEPKKATLKRTLLADLTAALSARPDLVLVKLADGSEDNWTFLSRQVPQGIEILDFFHAAEHLNTALGSVHGEGSVPPASVDGSLLVRKRLDAGTYAFVYALTHVGLRSVWLDELILQASLTPELDR
jgi:hypothetical protein